MENYNPRDWYWQIDGDDSKAWSSAEAGYVTTWPEDRLTKIANEVELYDVLTRANLSDRAPSRSFSFAEVKQALKAVDAVIFENISDVAALRTGARLISFNLPPDIA